VEGRECIDRNSEATQRYHYVVDRVLGVEVWIGSKYHYSVGRILGSCV
jgi:hypothetical protein